MQEILVFHNVSLKMTYTQFEFWPKCHAFSRDVLATPLHNARAPVRDTRDFALTVTACSAIQNKQIMFSA